MFVSQKRIEANRRNAQKSTGPRTEEGKARVSQNGLKHGLYATKPILTIAGWAEQPADYDSLCTALTAELRPASPVEHLLVRRLTAYAWHLSRAEKIAEALEAKPLSEWTLRQAQGEVASDGEKRGCDAVLAMTEKGAEGLLRSREARDSRNDGVFDVSSVVETRHFRSRFTTSPLDCARGVAYNQAHIVEILVRRLRARIERTFDTLQSVRENRHPALVAQIEQSLEKRDALDAKPFLEKVV